MAWSSRLNWLTNQPLATWYGITSSSDGTITSLDLDGNGLVGSIPAEVGVLTGLEVLNISNNPGLAGTLPVGMTALPLREFYFSGTNLEENQEMAFQDWLNGIEIVERSVTSDTSVQEESFGDKLELYQNYPNPFNQFTEFRFRLLEPAQVRLTLFNIYGQRIRVVTDSNYPAGLHRITWFAEGLASGVYLYRIEANDHAATKKLMVVN